MPRWTAVLALTVLLAGCGGDDPGERQAAPPVWQSATPTVPPRPAGLTPAAARTRYLEIVTPYNTALEELEDAVNSGKPWRTVRSLAVEVARTNAVHAAELRETVWPATVEEPLAALLKENDIALRHWRRAGEATNADALIREIRAAASHSGADEAGKVRAALGLPAYQEG